MLFHRGVRLVGLTEISAPATRRSHQRVMRRLSTTSGLGPTIEEGEEDESADSFNEDTPLLDMQHRQSDVPRPGASPSCRLTTKVQADELRVPYMYYSIACSWALARNWLGLRRL